MRNRIDRGTSKFDSYKYIIIKKERPLLRINRSLFFSEYLFADNHTDDNSYGIQQDIAQIENTAVGKRLDQFHDDTDEKTCEK